LRLAREAPWFIIRLAGQAQYRRSRLNSNVRPHHARIAIFQPMKSKTPQEKKLAEYVRDGRNLRAESRGIAHKAIAKRKAWVNRSFRKVSNQSLSANLGSSEDAMNLAELGSRSVQRHNWRKEPDVPLATYVEFKQGFAGKCDQVGKKTRLRLAAAKLAKAKYGK
jgi:hypothetical protein